MSPARAVALLSEQRPEFDGIEAVGPGPALAAVDFDVQGIKDEVLEPPGIEETMNSEAAESSLLAGDDRGVLGQAESLWRP